MHSPPPLFFDDQRFVFFFTKMSKCSIPKICFPDAGRCNLEAHLEFNFLGEDPWASRLCPLMHSSAFDQHVLPLFSKILDPRLVQYVSNLGCCASVIPHLSSLISKQQYCLEFLSNVSTGTVWAYGVCTIYCYCTTMLLQQLKATIGFTFIEECPGPVRHETWWSSIASQQFILFWNVSGHSIFPLYFTTNQVS